MLSLLKTREFTSNHYEIGLEAIQKLNSPMTVKGCRSFTGMVNFLRIFCPELQKLLKPIYDLTRKGRQFIWGEEQQLAFEEIKCRLVKLPVLHLLDNNNQEISTIKIIMIREMIKIDIGQIVEIEEHQTEVEVSMDRIIEEDHIILITIEMILKEIISEICKIIEVRILEVDTERIIEMIISEEIGVDLGTDNIQVILEGMIEEIVGLDQVQEPVLIEIELDVINVGNMIILLRTFQLHN